MHGVSGRSTPLAVGAAKASVGHSEAVSGQVGVLKVRRLLEHMVASANAQLRVLNPLVGERLQGSSSQFGLATQAPGDERCASVWAELIRFQRCDRTHRVAPRCC